MYPLAHRIHFLNYLQWLNGPVQPGISVISSVGGSNFSCMPKRFCTRVSCAERASAILLINARDLSAQVVDIAEDTGIAGVLLCRTHADAVAVPVGWTQADLRPPAEEPDFEPELVLIDDDTPDATEAPGAFSFPDKAIDDDDDLDDEVLGEVPPLLSRAFRAAGLD